MAVFSGPEIVNDGLVLHLDAANDRSYPGSGTTWTDLSGNSNNGTLVNGPLYSSDNNGYITFDGSNDYIKILHNESLQVGDELTLETLFYLDGNSYSEFDPTALSLFNKRVSAATTSYFLFIYNSTGDQVTFDFGDGSSNNPNRWLTGYIPPLKQWIHLAITRNISGRALYVNGELINSTGDAGTKTVGTADIFISKNQEGSDNYYWKGYNPINRIYNRALSKVEIQQNFNALRGRYGI